jgi:hypothetical protein
MIEAVKGRPATLAARASGQNIDGRPNGQSKTFLFRQTASRA